MYTIRVVNFGGDITDLEALLVVGPYPTPEHRDIALDRLTRLPDVAAMFELVPSDLDPRDALWSCTPRRVAHASDVHDLVEALYGLRFVTDPGGAQ